MSSMAIRSTFNKPSDALRRMVMLLAINRRLVAINGQLVVPAGGQLKSPLLVR